MHGTRKTIVGVAMVGLAVFAPHRVHGQPDHGAHERLGTVHFETSCAPSSGPAFDRAMALLHSFEFAPAIAGFQSVLKTDSSCGIAEWGIAMATWGNPFSVVRPPRALQDGLAAVGRAQTIGAKSEREREYISAVAQLYAAADTRDQRTRTLDYERAMERLAQKHSKDAEASIFYALSVNQTAPPTDKTFANQLKAADILERLFKAQPEHPGITHYLIHSYDVPPLAQRGLAFARRYADLASDAPHALHMPSHTFTRVGSWQESIDTNIRSRDAALKLRESGEATHAMDYMTYAYLQTAQDSAAKSVVDSLATMIAAPAGTYNGPTIGGGFPGNAIPARWALERGEWADAAALPVRPATQPYMEAITRFARALGAARSGRPDAANVEVEQLAALRDKEIAAKDEYWTTQVEIQRQAAEAWMLWAQGKSSDAIALMRKAAALEDTTEKAAVTPGPLAPAHELLGEMLIEAKRPGEALKEFETGLEKEPNRFRSVYGAGRAAELAGDKNKARTYYAQLIKICEKSGASPRQELAHARSFASR